MLLQHCAQDNNLNNELAYVGEFGSKGNGSGQFNEPMGLACLKMKLRFILPTGNTELFA